MRNRSDESTSLEVTELDNDNVPLLDEAVHPFDYEKVVRIYVRATPDLACAYSVRRR
jgi:hypothetical protein